MRYSLSLCLILFSMNIWAADPPPTSDKVNQEGRYLGDVKIVRALMTQSIGIALGDDGTVYIVSTDGKNGPSHFRISRPGVAKELLMYKGWPYILDKRGNLYALSSSLATTLNNKLPYITIRFFKTIPIAFAAGVGTYAIGLIDNTFFGLVMGGANFSAASAFFGGVLGFYGIDISRTIFLKSQRAIGRGGNFFTQIVARNVQQITPNDLYDDYTIETYEWPKKTKQHNLSQLIPGSVAGKTCVDYLTRLNLE